MDDFEADVCDDVNTGTTIMAVEFNGGVVIGADSRTSAGQYVCNRAARKITQLHNRIVVARSGSAADTQALAGYVRRFLGAAAIEQETLPSVKTAASLMQLLAYENKRMLTAALIIAGWDDSGGGQVYQIPLGGTCLRSKYAIGGSGSSYVTALVETSFKEGMSRDECVEFVKGVISRAIYSDGHSGGVIRLYVVTEDAVTQEFVHAAQVEQLCVQR